jgi:hypothetical protein
MWDSATTWHLEPVTRIGSLEGEGPSTFGQIIALEIDALGRIYVLDRLAQELRVFGPDGEHIRTIGGEGEGPGEFRGANGLGWGPNGNLWVVDQRLRRFTVLDTSGTLLRTHRAPMSVRSWQWRGGFTQSGALYDFGSVREGEEYLRALLKFDMVGEYSDTFLLASYEAEFFEWETARSRATSQVPFAPQQVWMVAPDGDLRTGIADQYRIHHVTLTSDTIRIIAREYEPIPVIDTERQQAVERISEFMAGRRFDESRIPVVKPAFESLGVDDSGFLWVRLPDSPARQGTLLDVFDPEGRFLGTLNTQEPLYRYSRFFVRGDILYYVTTDEFDVAYVIAEQIVGR